jgi:hypothetical protein
LDKLHKISALIVLAAILSCSTTLVYAQAQEETISFKLEGTHQEDTVSETAEALGFNVTVFEPLNNGTILVNATKLVTK